MTFDGFLFISYVLALTALVVTGIVGRRRVTRPRCARCRHSLTTMATIPSICPGCGADLTAKVGSGRAIQFGGYRPRLRLVVVAAILVVTPILFSVVVRAVTTTPPRFIDGVAIEERVTAVRLDQATAAGDETTWAWVAAHLKAKALSMEMRRVTAKKILDAVASGVAHGELVNAVVAAGDELPALDFAAAIVEGAPPPTITIARRREGRFAIEIGWPQPDPWSRVDLPVRRVMAIERIRVNGEVVRPSRPDRRFHTHLELSRHVVEPAAALPEDQAATIEVDLVWAGLRDPPPHIVEWHLPGPVASWPDPLGLRRVTVTTNLPPR